MPHSKHDPKQCAACGAAFNCCRYNIADCPCSSVKLTDESREQLAARFDDCLCADCLRRAAAGQFDLNPVNPSS